MEQAMDMDEVDDYIERQRFWRGLIENAMGPARLTERELTVFLMVLAGAQNYKVARALGVTKSRAANLRDNAFRKVCTASGIPFYGFKKF